MNKSRIKAEIKSIKSQLAVLVGNDYDYNQRLEKLEDNKYSPNYIPYDKAQTVEARADGTGDNYTKTTTLTEVTDRDMLLKELGELVYKNYSFECLTCTINPPKDTVKIEFPDKIKYQIMININEIKALDNNK